MEIFRAPHLVREVPVDQTSSELDREWIVTNGLGGYASGTIAGLNTRRFHGWLIAALPAPHGRMMMMNQIEETLYVGDRVYQLTADNLSRATQTDTVSPFLKSFRLESGLPVFTYASDDFTLEKRLCMVHAQNTTYITYSLLEGEGARLELRPAIDIRPHEGSVGGPRHEDYRFSAISGGYELAVSSDLPSLKLAWVGDDTAFRLSIEQVTELRYRVEQSRGYDWQGNLWSPGWFCARLSKGRNASLVISTEHWGHVNSLSPDHAFSAEAERRRRLLRSAPEEARSGIAAELVFAADQFLITPVGRTADAVQAHSIGDEVRTVIAGYHWFTDWGRDTMISLEGLTIATGRTREAEYILRSFAKYIKDGLIPNMFPEGKTSGLYNTADATLWFFHAVNCYIRSTQDSESLEVLLPKLLDIINWHQKGTRFGIGVDPSDGLLHQGAEGLQLTWMDAKVGDWVVTPRRGKAVEINALWYNALCVTAGWLETVGDKDRASELSSAAGRVRESFNRRFWAPQLGYCYDVVDKEGGGDDPSLRPNQILAISLPHAVLAEDKWKPVLNVTRERLLTPYGLRSLAPGEPDYKPRYDGDLLARDAAYHQGTVWAWLIGPFFDAWLRTYPGDLNTARSLLAGFNKEMSQAGIGTISEIFDAEPPYDPRGCIAQAWSVAEVLRCELKLRRARKNRTADAEHATQHASEAR
ncbi:MAG: glycogen debranching enzyme family protein [Acidobacteriaceae bacterium]|nr:glycogen debranching enzyme family protein [Acidobacteriaceae bacterium]